jgi:hypothetical protein
MAFQKLVDLLISRKVPGVMSSAFLKEIITMQAHEFFATYIDIGNDSYDVLRQCKWLPQNETHWN